MLYQHAVPNIRGFVVNFVDTSGRSWSFQTRKLEVLRPNRRNYFSICISMILCTDCVVKYVSLDQIFHVNNVEWFEIYNFINEMFKTEFKNLLSFISINLS